MDKLNEFWKEVERREQEPRHTPLSKGMTYYNALLTIEPTLARRVYGTLLDPSHDESKIDKFLFYIKQAWGA